MANLITNKKLLQINKIMRRAYDKIEEMDAENIKLRAQIVNNDAIKVKINSFIDNYQWMNTEIEEKDVDIALKEAKDLGI
mgnify:CR=1 FL=1